MYLHLLRFVLFLIPKEVNICFSELSDLKLGWCGWCETETHRWVSVIELQLSNARTRSAFSINWSLRFVLLWGFSGRLYQYHKNAECLWCKCHSIQTAEIYGQTVSWLIPHNHWIPLSELNRRIASWIGYLKSKFKNSHTICCVLKGIFVDSEPPLTPLNLTCPSYSQKGLIWKSLFLPVQL